jgi:hypothetical protein
MSAALRKVLHGVVNDLKEAEANVPEFCDDALRSAVEISVGKLETVISLLPDESPEQKWINPGTGNQFGYHKEMSHQALAAKATAEARAARAAAGIEEVAPRMVVCKDGPEQGTYASLNAQMPVGAFVNVGRHTYQLNEDGTLHHKASQAPPKTVS